jgi:serine protease Do
MLSIVMGTAVASAAAADAPPAAERGDFRAIVRSAKSRVFPTVVYLKCLRETMEGGTRITTDVTGSGFLISPEGEALTNWHVVDDAVQVRCLLSDGRAMDAEVVGTDKATDLALIRLQPPADGGPLPYAEIGDSRVLQEGDFVMAMGAPWGLNRSVSIGIVSCARRFLPETSEYSLWLQTDAAINPGNSGGPLVSTDGRVIGINTRGMDFGDGMGFAVPAETIAVLLPQLRAHGRVNWSWMGVQLQALRDFGRNIYFEGDAGVIVAATEPGSPGRRAGLQPRDRILAVGGRPVTATTEEDLPAVRMLLGMLPMDEPVSLEIVRGTEHLDVEVVPTEKGRVEGEELDCPRWDLTVKAINRFENEDLFFHRERGVFIYGVKFPGNAGASGLRHNDIILSIDGKPVETLDDVRRLHLEAVANVEQRHRVVFAVLRGGLMRRVVLDFSRDYEKD